MALECVDKSFGQAGLLCRKWQAPLQGQAVAAFLTVACQIFENIEHVCPLAFP